MISPFSTRQESALINRSKSPIKKALGKIDEKNLIFKNVDKYINSMDKPIGSPKVKAAMSPLNKRAAQKQP